MALTAAMMLVACTTPDPDPSPQEPTTSMDSASVDANDALALAGDLTLPDNLTVETVVDVGDDRTWRPTSSQRAGRQPPHSSFVRR